MPRVSKSVANGSFTSGPLEPFPSTSAVRSTVRKNLHEIG